MFKIWIYRQFCVYSWKCVSPSVFVSKEFFFQFININSEDKDKRDKTNMPFCIFRQIKTFSDRDLKKQNLTHIQYLKILLVLFRDFKNTPTHIRYFKILLAIIWDFKNPFEFLRDFKNFSQSFEIPNTHSHAWRFQKILGLIWDFKIPLAFLRNFKIPFALLRDFKILLAHIRDFKILHGLRDFKILR